MTNPIDSVFSALGRAPVNSIPSDLLTDEILAIYLDGGLSPADCAALERRVLTDPAAFELYRAAVDVIGMRPARESEPFRILARIHERGLKVLNELEHRFWALVDGSLQPALGPLRAGAVAEPDLLTVLGPGNGLDELDLQLQSDGSTRLEVRSRVRPEVGADEKLSILLETDGQVREKRPFEGDRAAFDGLVVGRHVVTLQARAPGGQPRTLARAEVALQA